MKSRITYIIILLICNQACLMAQGDQLSFEPAENFRIHPSGINQTEVFITNSPLNKNILFSSCNTLNFIPFFISEGIYVSSDGGNTWEGNDTCTGEPVSFHGGDPGIAIDKNGTFILTRLGRSPFSGLYSHYSNDNGLTWSAQQVISTDDLERAAIASDIFPSSMYYGRTYASWVKFAQPFPIMLSYTDNGGISWSEPQQINNPPNRSAGGDNCVGPEGEVYVCWAGVTDVSPFKEIYVGFAASSDGGMSWDITENAYPMNGITGLLPEKGNIRVNGLPNIAVDTSGGDRRGWLYITTGQKNLSPAGSDPDVILNVSSDKGQNWSPGIRVNRDATDNGKIQYFPTIHVDKFGAVDIIYYDDRNTSSDSAGVFLSRSADGGITWKEYEISDHNYKPEAIGGLGQGYQGDNIDITSTDSKLCPVWMDNSSGTYQIWTVPIDFSTLDHIKDQKEGFSCDLSQNRPNPFNNHTSIAFTLDKAERVSLIIYDQNGKAINLLVDEIKTAGKHDIDFNAEAYGMKPGIYIYTLLVGRQSISKKMLLLP